MPLKAVGYQRVSTSGQGDSGLGLAAQLEAIEKTAAKLGLPLLMFGDVLSGSLALDQRPGLAEALNALRRGDVLVVAKRDRIARDSFLAVLIEREVQKKGCRILSASGEGTDSDDPAATFTRRILDAVAELERALIAARTRAALQALKRQGLRAGHLPYGHLLAPDGRTLLPNESEQATLTTMRAIRSTGATLRATARALNDLGLPTRRGGQWCHQSVALLLGHESYTATMALMTETKEP